MLDGIMPIPILLAFAIALPVVRSEHALILETVYLNGIGPLRMVVDTGAQSTAVTPAVAARIGVKPRFRVEHLTVSGAHLVTGGYVHMQTGAFEADSVETIICELDGARRLTNIDGVIGQSWLARFNYLIDLRADALVLDAQPPPGRRQPFSLIDGRPAISIAIDGRLRTVVLDSGTAGLVLFGKPTMGESVLVRTNNGSSQATRNIVLADVPSVGRKRVMATVMSTPTAQPGLFPLTMFSAVYVNNREQYLIVSGT